MEGLMRALRGIRGSGYNYDLLEGPGGRQRQRAGGEGGGREREVVRECGEREDVLFCWEITKFCVQYCITLAIMLCV